MKPSRHFIGQRPSVNVDFWNNIVKRARFLAGSLVNRELRKKAFYASIFKDIRCRL
jgi:hypothetical protein